MGTPDLKVILLLFFLPIFVFGGGAWIASAVSGRHAVVEQQPLNQRPGYDTKDVAQYWGALDSSGLRAEQRFLELDLVFPTLYGLALAVSLLTISAMLRSPIHTAWLIAPVVVTVVADWIENLVQLDQLRNFIESGEKGLSAGWIHLSSTVTIVKLLFGVISFLVLFARLFTLYRSSRVSPMLCTKPSVAADAVN